MADDTVTFGVGLLGGILIVLAIFVVLRLHQQEQQQGGQAQMTTHNVVRDDQGRIQSVDTLSGLPLDGSGGSQPRQRQPVGPAQTQERPPADPMRN